MQHLLQHLLQRLRFWRAWRTRRQTIPHAIPRWLRKRMLSPRALTAEREERKTRASDRVQAARAAVSDARARAEYHGWNGASGNAYTRAQDELLAALREQCDADPAEGCGAFGWAVLSALAVAGAVVGVFSAHVLR